MTQSSSTRPVGIITDEEINPFQEDTTGTPLMIRRQCCGYLFLCNDQYQCKNSHNRHNPLVSNAPVGIANLGLTCYISASLQSLLNIHEFKQNIASVFKEVQNMDGYTIIKHMGGFVNAYKLKDVHDMKKYELNLISEIGKRFTIFKLKKMQDASEFLQILIDLLDEELDSLSLAGSATNFIKTLFEFQILRPFTCNSCIQCNLTQKSKHFLCNQLADATSGKSIVNCIKETIEENLESSLCESCTIAPTTNWVTFPKVLIIHLSRSELDNTKLHDEVKIPTVFNIQLTVFNITAIISHEGNSLDFGHYVSDIKKDNVWYHCNDSIVKKAEENYTLTKCSRTSYILFYKRS